MKNRSIATLAVIASALIASAAPAMGLDNIKKQPDADVTLRASLQNNDFYTPQFFAPLGSVPASMAPNKAKFNSVKKVANSATSLVNFVFDLRGFDWSKEGANAILEEKLKPNSDAAREFLKHKEEDDRELSLVANTLQLASVEGLDEDKTKKAIDNLATVVGLEEATKLHEKLKAVGTADSTMLPNATAVLVEDKASTDVEQKCLRLKSVLEAASDSDPVVGAMTTRLHKYNHRNKFLQITAKAVYATLGVAAFTPTLAAPIAETTLLTFMMVTGGPEQDKLLKEVYLSKCLQSRAYLINEKAHLAVECYDMAIHTKNPRLLACSKDLIRQMTSEKAMAAFIGTTGDTSDTASTAVKEKQAIVPEATGTDELSSSQQI